MGLPGVGPPGITSVPIPGPCKLDDPSLPLPISSIDRIVVSRPVRGPEGLGPPSPRRIRAVAIRVGIGGEMVGAPGEGEVAADAVEGLGAGGGVEGLLVFAD